VTILPSEFDGVVAHETNLPQLCVGNVDKVSLRAVSLTQGAGTVTTKILLRILSNVTIIPGDPHTTVRFNVINFSRAMQFQMSPTITLPSLRLRP
jgi:hypothetical protein